jgi:purine-binding chemotaxis protein CheW
MATEQDTQQEDDLFLVDDESDGEAEDKHLLFRLADEEYGVPIDRVQSIEELQKIVAVPDMPSYVRGVINLRGNVIPVVDLRLRFGMPPREYDDRTCIIIINADSRVVGFIVDTVSEVHPIPEKNIQEAPEFRSGDDKEKFVTGLGTVEGEVKILLDIDQLVQKEEVPDATLSLEAQKLEAAGKA